MAADVGRSGKVAIRGSVSVRRFFSRLRGLFGGRTAEQEMTREMDAHLGLLAEEFERRVD